uniref:Uncharacterized protein n=1 Tax=Myoviridae sp. ctNQV2 TaxID=2827683 RepID=A0A8S5S0C2_9CAUD|nr:MAG TPA: hypothetical protein [Myoviridae sp. ctNQV2]
MTSIKMYWADSCCGYSHYSLSTIAINSIVI